MPTFTSVQRRLSIVSWSVHCVLQVLCWSVLLAPPSLAVAINGRQWSREHTHSRQVVVELVLVVVDPPGDLFPCQPKQLCLVGPFWLSVCICSLPGSPFYYFPYDSPVLASVSRHICLLALQSPRRRRHSHCLLVSSLFCFVPTCEQSVCVSCKQSAQRPLSSSTVASALLLYLFIISILLPNCWHVQWCVVDATADVFFLVAWPSSSEMISYCDLSATSCHHHHHHPHLSICFWNSVVSLCLPASLGSLACQFMVHSIFDFILASTLRHFFSAKCTNTHRH